MRHNSNNSFWLAMGIAAGTAWTVSQAIRRRQVEKWQGEWPQGYTGTALVTGASSGIGEVYARRLAEKGFDLILVARRVEKLEAVVEAIRKEYGRRAEVLPADLADPQGIAKVEERLHKGDVSFLVNNAGFGIPSSFLRIPPDELDAMIQVHDVATVRLAHAALPGMVTQGCGAVVNVSSMLAFFSLPGDAIYGASKAFLNNLSESLGISLAGKGVRMQALCPGFTHTGFHSTEAYTRRDVHSHIPSFLWLQAEDVVDESLRCLETNQMICVPSRIYKFLAFLGRTGIGQAAIRLVVLASPDLIPRLRGRVQPEATGS